MTYKIREDALTTEIYTELRAKVNFKEYPKEDVKEAIKNSIYTVVVFDEDRPIGIARIIGDNRIVFFIKDVVVDPEYQKLRIGNLLMKAMFEYIDKHACEGAYIGLMSTPQCTSFYKKHGFIERPTDGLGPGMVQFYSRKEVSV